MAQALPAAKLLPVFRPILAVFLMVALLIVLRLVPAVLSAYLLMLLVWFLLVLPVRRSWKEHLALKTRLVQLVLYNARRCEQKPLRSSKRPGIKTVCIGLSPKRRMALNVIGSLSASFRKSRGVPCARLLIWGGVTPHSPLFIENL